MNTKLYLVRETGIKKQHEAKFFKTVESWNITSYFAENVMKFLHNIFHVLILFTTMTRRYKFTRRFRKYSNLCGVWTYIISCRTAIIKLTKIISEFNKNNAIYIFFLIKAYIYEFLYIYLSNGFCDFV